MQSLCDGGSSFSTVTDPLFPGSQRPLGNWNLKARVSRKSQQLPCLDYLVHRYHYDKPEFINLNELLASQIVQRMNKQTNSNNFDRSANSFQAFADTSAWRIKASGASLANGLLSASALPYNVLDGAVPCNTY